VRSCAVAIEVAYPAAGVKSGADGSVVEGDKLADVVDVGAGAAREHGAAPGEAELVAVDADPILHRLLDAELLVRHVGEPGDVAAGRPRERVAVALGRRDEAPEALAGRGAVALPVDEAVAGEPQGTLHVLAGRVLGVLGGACFVVAMAERALRLHSTPSAVWCAAKSSGPAGGDEEAVVGAGVAQETAVAIETEEEESPAAGPAEKPPWCQMPRR
jgi:hypothetical protein